MNDNSQRIAIVGMSCSLPGISNPIEFMDFLNKKQSNKNNFPQKRKRDLLPFIDDVYHHHKAKYLNIDYQEGGYLKQVDKFDHEYFKISPSEAEIMDPAQRLFLQQSIKAIEDAGYSPEMIRGSNTGVYLGYMPDYRPFNYKELLLKKPEQYFDLQVPNNLPAVIASRLSYFLDLKGPAICVDTACSSVITALDLAVKALQKGSITGALVGGVKLMLAPIIVNGQRIAIESLNFESKPFDDSADGVGIGEGIGALYLKPLSLAKKDNDFIYSIIEATSTNQDGRSLGLAAPNPRSQKEVIQKTWEMAKISPENIKYIEAHGTGTALGDPIEVEALTNAFESQTASKQFCYLSSVKSNIGHLYEASGIPSMIKASLCVCFKKKIPINNFNTPNKAINFAKTPFYIGKHLEEWEDKKRYCGINSFGMSGTNAHVVISNDDDYNSTSDNEDKLLVISAKSKESLIGLAQDYVSFLDRNLFSFSDICYTSRVGRSHYKYRFAILAKNHTEAKKMISSKLYQTEEIDNCYVGQANDALKDIAKHYVEGTDIDWPNFFDSKKDRKVPIPTYSFAEKRAWVKFDPAYEESIRNKNKFHHHCTYEKYLELDKCSSLLPKNKVLNLAICSSKEDLKNISSSLTSAGFKIFAAVTWSESYKLIDLLKKTSQEVRVVWFGQKNNAIDYRLLQPLSLRKLAKGLCTLPGIPELNIVSHCGCYAHEGSFVDPIQKMTHGLAVSLEKETKIKVCIIDRSDKEKFTNIVQLLKYEISSLFTLIHDGWMHKRVFTNLPILSTTKSTDCLHNGGVYVLFGGLGGIGLSIAKYLVEQCFARVIILSRSGNIRPYYQEKFDSLLNNSQIDIRKNFTGTTKEWDDLLANIIDKYGSIHGIYHLAGIPSAHLMINESDDDLARVINPKIDKTLALINSLNNLNIKTPFIALFSSVASFFPAVGQSSYSMANNFMDGISLSQSNNIKHICSIAWVAWKDIGMALDAKTNVDTSFKAILSNDAIEQMHRIISAKATCVLVGEINYKMSQMVKDLTSYGYELGGEIISKLDDTRQTINTNQALEDINVELIGTSSSNPKNLETVAKIWSRHLGYKKLNVTDRLYDDLGGDSIIATQIADDIKNYFNCELNISDIVDSSLEEIAFTINSDNK